MKRGLTEPPPPPRVVSAILPKTIFKEHSSFISINNSLDLALTPHSTFLGAFAPLVCPWPFAPHSPVSLGHAPLSPRPCTLIPFCPFPPDWRLGLGGGRFWAKGGLGGGKRGGQCLLPVLVGMPIRIGGQGTPLVLDAPLSLDCLLLLFLRLGKSYSTTKDSFVTSPLCLLASPRPPNPTPQQLLSGLPPV